MQGTIISTLPEEKMNLVTALAIGLKEHCQNWGYDYIEQLKKNPSVDNFVKQFNSKNIDLSIVTMKDSDVPVGDYFETEWEGLSEEAIGVLEEIKLADTNEKSVIVNDMQFSHIEDYEKVAVKIYVLYDDGNCNYDSTKLKRIKGLEPFSFEVTSSEYDYKELELPIPYDINNSSIVLMVNTELVKN